MSLFKRRQRPTAPPSSSSAGYSVLDAQLTVRGDIETVGTLRVDGRLEGSILRADIVVLGLGSAVVGDINAREVIVGGTVNGNVTASARTELQPTAVVTGNIEAGAIMIHEGGAVQGRLTVNPAAAKERSSSARNRDRAEMAARAAANSAQPVLSEQGA